MDAGWVALLGASVTAIAAVGAAATSGWLMHRQVRTVARAEHRRERAGPREEAYEDFLQTALVIQDYLAVIYDENFRSRYIDSELAERVCHAYYRMYGQRAKLLLVGPPAVSQAAESMVDDMASLELYIRVFRQAPVPALFRRMWQRLDDLVNHTQEFIGAARLALDEESGPDPLNG
ncbi:hypothetical protein ACFXBB_06285 [Streptomyces scopuliridis]|uniref:hypothetical protein n=1 Tax=Streptomyces scopuliridis TaxID=452529 RepID=UPI00368154F5